MAKDATINPTEECDRATTGAAVDRLQQLLEPYGGSIFVETTAMKQSFEVKTKRASLAVVLAPPPAPRIGACARAPPSLAGEPIRVGG
jgi:hypothetical protein